MQMSLFTKHTHRHRKQTYVCQRGKLGLQEGCIRSTLLTDTCCAVLSRSLMSSSLRVHRLSLPGSSIHGDSPSRNTEVGLPCPPPGDLPNPGIEPRSPTLQADSLPSESPGKPQKIHATVHKIGK